ncbi:MAG: muconolactone Delta-isomerase [Pseudomonadota bacterium]
MKFMVEMTVKLPHDLDQEVVADMLAREKARAQELQRQGVWVHLWRVTGRYANVSIFELESAEALHDIMLSLPLFPYMETKVTSLCQHPSAIVQEN